MTSEYSKKAAMVTGAGSGIGREIARLLESRGWRVAAADLKAGRRDAGIFPALRCVA